MNYWSLSNASKQLPSNLPEHPENQLEHPSNILHKQVNLLQKIASLLLLSRNAPKARSGSSCLQVLLNWPNSFQNPNSSHPTDHNILSKTLQTS